MTVMPSSLLCLVRCTVYLQYKNVHSVVYEDCLP